MGEIRWPGRLGDGCVTLRDLEERDVEAYVAAFEADPDLGRLLGMESDPTSAAVHEGMAAAPQARAAGRFLEVAVADRADDRFLGSLQVHSLHPRHRRAELGVWLDHAARGRGLALRSTALLIEWAWSALGAERLEMTTTPDNRGIPGLAGRLGFVREGTMRARNLERGRRVDVVMFGLLREEWRHPQEGVRRPRRG